MTLFADLLAAAADHWGWIAFALHAAIIAGAFMVVPVNRKPSSATAWLLLIVVAPFFGASLFFLIGSPKLPRRRREIQRRMNEQIERALASTDDAIWRAHLDPCAFPAAATPHARLAKALGGMPPVAHNRLTPMTGYDNIIAEMVAAIENARHFVHVEFYIVAIDETTEPFFRALEAAVRRGVKVRLLFDQLGSRKFPRRKEMQQRLTDAGIEWRAMLPVLRLKEWLRFDLRNHRKILVVDNRVAFAGSLNLITKGYHRQDAITYEELCIRVEGPAVIEFEAVFVTDWLCETGQLLAQDDHPALPDAAPCEGASAQVLPSGSGFDYENNLRLFTSLIEAAQKRLVIATPYFVPDEAMMMALTSAAKRGVAVTLLNSEAVDQDMVVAAQRSFYEELMRAGIEIRRYAAPVLLHAKTMIVDDDLAAIGSSNMDLRSFTLNMEVTLLVYDAATVQKLHDIVAVYLACSNRIDPEVWRARSLRSKIGQNVARLTSALQ